MTTIPLGRLVELRTAKDDGAAEFKVGLEHIEGHSGKLISSDAEYSGEGVSFDVGDILFGKLRPYLAKVWRADRPGSAVGDFHVYRARPGIIDTRYLTYALLSHAFLDPVTSSVYGAKMPRVSWDFVRTLGIDVPELSEQSKITVYLDRETAQIDTLIAKQEQLIATLRERLKRTIDTAIQSPPARTVQLRYVSEVPITSGLDEQSDSSNPVEWPRFIRTTDIQDVFTLNPGTRVTVDPSMASAAKLQDGDLLFTRAGATIGKSYLHQGSGDAAYAGYLVRVRPRVDKALPRYLAYWSISSEFEDQISAGAIKSTIENFSASKYRAVRIRLPGLAEQREVADRLDEQTAKINTLIAKAERFIELSKERRAALITAAVTGQFEIPS